MARHFAEGTASLRKMNAVFSMCCKWRAACMSECVLRNEVTMCQEMKAALHSFGGRESLNQPEDTVHAQFASPSSQFFPSASFVELRNTIPTHIDIVSPFVDQLMGFISTFRADESNFEIELALREALVNAIVHGNQQDPHKRVYVRCRCTTDGEVSIRVEDQGHGFENDAIPDPTSADNLLRANGRGIYLMRTLMDEVNFEQGGSVVHMRKRANAGPDTTRKPQ
jgi:serine/threonine-protein kinase RsbW